MTDVTYIYPTADGGTIGSFLRGKFFHYRLDAAEAADALKRWTDPNDKFAPRAGDVSRQGQVVEVHGEVVWVRLFSFLDGTNDGGIASLPAGDWSRWTFYDTDKDMRDAYAWFGYTRGFWSIDDYMWQTGQAREVLPPEPTPMRQRRPDNLRNRYRREITKAKRFAILKRDGFKCRYCGATEKLHLDHVVPLAKGGTNDEANLVAACEACNLGKRTDDAEPPELRA